MASTPWIPPAPGMVVENGVFLGGHVLRKLFVGCFLGI